MNAASAPVKRGVAISRRDWMVLALLVLVSLLVPAGLNRGLVFIAGMIWINAVFGLAFNLLFGMSGVLSFGQAMFFAAGAYLCALLLQSQAVPFVLMVPLAGLLGAALATAVGVVALRRSEGVYFAILTLAFAELVHLLIANTSVLGRNDGLAGLARPRLGGATWGLDLAQGDRFYFAIVVICALLIAFVRWLQGTPFARALQALKQDPDRAEFLGIPVKRHRLAIFAIAGGVTAAAGALVAPWAQIVTPELAHWSNSTNPILYTLLGGSAYFWGPVLGAIVLSCVFYATRTLVGLSDMVTGLLLLGVVLSLPGGILGLVDRLRRPAPEPLTRPATPREATR
ncbi:MAG: branched-chain amino acid ABC transporter permease [Herbaspirillum sp.]